MPLYKFECRTCNKPFEYLIRENDTTPICPRCGSKDSIKLFSRSAIKLSTHFHFDKPPAASVPEQDVPGGTVRVPMYADRNTGMPLGDGAPEVVVD